MNKKAVEAMPALLALVGGVTSWIMASRMNAGIVMKVITALATLVVCYFLVSFIGNK